MILLPGVAAFLLFVLFDLNKIQWHRRFLNLFFALGGLLLIGSTVLCILASDLADFVWHAGTVLGLIACAASAAGMVYALFFALPFQDTYTQGHDVPVISTGLYGLCRHPAFWPMLALYVLLWLTFGGSWLLAAAVLYPLCNLLYIYIQDRWIFPQYIRGYHDYQKQVPFLIPRRK